MRRYWDDMEVALGTVAGFGAEVTGLVDCWKGEVAGCVATVGFTLMGGVFTTIVGRTTRVIKLSQSKLSSAAGNSAMSGGRKAAKGRTSQKSDHGVAKNGHDKHHEPTVKKRAAEAEAARAQTVRDTLRPDGRFVGESGSRTYIRVVAGGKEAALTMFAKLKVGGTVIEDSAKVLRVRLPDGGVVTYRREMTRSPGTGITIDVNIPEVGEKLKKVKFVP